MALTTAGTARNAVMILKGISSTMDIEMNAYMRGTFYSFKFYQGTSSGLIACLYRDNTILSSRFNYSVYNAYLRITLSNDSIKVESFYTSSPPAVTGGTPTWTLSATDSTYLGSGVWQYDDTYYKLISFTYLDYVITYAPNEGTMSSTTQVYVGSPLTLFTAAREGYTFDGWYTASNVLISGPYTPTGNITLYAHWKANQYTLTFNYSNTTPTEVLSKVVTYGNEIGELPIISPPLGWDVTQGWLVEESPITASTIWNYSTDKTALPSLTRTGWVLTYNANGGINPPAAEATTTI